jgi:hypothetical protein
MNERVTTSRNLACYQTRKTPDFAPTQQFAMHRPTAFFPQTVCKLFDLFAVRLREAGSHWATSCRAEPELVHRFF